MDSTLPGRRLESPDEPSYRHKRPALIVTVGLMIVATLSAFQLRHPVPVFGLKPFGTYLSRALPFAAPSASAFGESGGVLLKFALPNQIVEYPLDVHGDPTALAYSWVRNGDTASVEAGRPLNGAEVRAPLRPGFYRLALVRGDKRRIIEGLTVAVLVPFKDKEGAMLNGYRIGTYLAERLAGGQEPPEGFLEINPSDVDLPISKHLRVGDFLNHDSQDTWPRYAAVSPRLLDKLELVIAELARWHGGTVDDVHLALDVHSGFRAPDHNRQIARAARDSQHQYGDAADVAIDANGRSEEHSLNSSHPRLSRMPSSA